MGNMDFLRQLFSSGDFSPRGYCYLWNPGLVWLNVISDGLIALAYFMIPAALVWFIPKRRDLELKLRISEARYRENAELLDLTDDAIFVKDIKNEIVFWNLGAERLYGWRKEETREKFSYSLLQTVFPKPVG